MFSLPYFIKSLTLHFSRSLVYYQKSETIFDHLLEVLKALTIPAYLMLLRHRRIYFIPLCRHLQIILQDRMALACPGGSVSCQLSHRVCCLLPCHVTSGELHFWAWEPMTPASCESAVVRGIAVPLFSGVDFHKDLPTSKKRAGRPEAWRLGFKFQPWHSPNVGLEQVTLPLSALASLLPVEAYGSHKDCVRNKWGEICAWQLEGVQWVVI